MLSWFYLFIAITLEVAGTICLRFSQELKILIVAMLLYTTCSFFFVSALKNIELTVAYTIWAGLGAVLVTCFGILGLHEPAKLMKFIGIGIIVVGIIGLKMGNPPLKNLDTNLLDEKQGQSEFN